MTIARDMALAECLIEKGNVEEAEELIASIEKALKTKTHQLDDDEDDDDDVEDDWSGVKHIFYSWRERSWRKPLILLELRGRFCENVVPRL